MHNPKITLFAFGAALLAFFPLRSAAQNVPVIIDNYTGFAIDGYDPVTYFNSSSPQQGIDGFEARWGGVSWRFVNGGNRKAFLISPQVYMPQFGGNDPVAMSRGTVTRGDPQTYLVYKDKLYFFFSPYSREDFMAQVERTTRAAEQSWQRLKNARD